MNRFVYDTDLRHERVKFTTLHDSVQNIENRKKKKELISVTHDPILS